MTKINYCSFCTIQLHLENKGIANPNNTKFICFSCVALCVLIIKKDSKAKIESITNSTLTKGNQNEKP